MAYVIDSTYTFEDSATSVTGVLPEHNSGDLLILFAGKDGSAGTWASVTGYTAVNDNSYSGTNAGIWYKVAGASETAPNASSGSLDQHFAIMVSVRDIASSAYDDGDNVSTSTANAHSSTALTTTVDDCLICYFYVGDNNRQPTFAPGVIAEVARSDQVDSGFAWTFHRSAGAAPTCTVNKEAGDDSQIFSIAIKSSASPVRPAIGDTSNACATIVSYCDNESSGPFGGGSYDPSTDISSTLDSKTFSYDAFGGATARKPYYFTGGLLSQFTNTGNVTGAVWTCTSIDLSGQRICAHISTQSGLYYDRLPPFSEKGIYFGLRSGSGAGYRIWHVSARNTQPNPSGQHVIVIDVDDTTYRLEDKGTFNSASVDGILFAGHNPSGSELRNELAVCAQLDTITLIEGSSTLPAKIETCQKLTNTAAILTAQNQNSQSSKGWLLFQDLQVGNGSDPVYFEDSGGVLEFPKVRTESERKISYNVAADTLTLTLYGVSGDTIKLTDYTVTSETTYNFTIHASSTSAATWDFSGLVIVNANVTWRDIHSTAASNITFRDCPSFEGNSADFSGGCTFDNTQITLNGATQVALQALLDDYANCSLMNGTTAIRIEYTGTGDITLSFDAMSFSGNTTDIHYNSTNSSALTATMDNGSDATTSAISGSATSVTISAPTNDLTVNVNESASQIHVYTTNTQTTLATESSASQLVYTHSAQTVDITVLKDGYIPYRQTALALSGDVTVDVQLVKSREYDSSHGLTYTTDASIYDNYNVITNISQANPAVVTYSGADNFSNGDIVSVHDVVGMTEVNGKRYTVANVDTGANTFELSGIDSTGYTAYSSAGIVVSGLSVPTFGPSGQGVFSLLMEQFKSNSSLYNLPFPLEMDGAGSLYLIDGVEGEADSDIENLTACGVGYLDVDATQTATWVGLESVGSVPAGAQGEWTADDGTTVTDARTTGVFDEVIKIHGDSDHGNFDWRANRIVAKMNVNGYREERVNVRELYGVSGNFTPNHYVIPISPVAIEAATGDPSLSTAPTITDHGASPVTWQGKSFAITITDGATPNTGEGLLRHLNYYLRSANDTTFNSKDPFSWPEMVKEVVAGTSYETIYGYTEDAQTGTLKGVRVVKNDGSTAHPDFIRFQADDGTYYTAPVSAQISITGMPATGANIRLQIHNETAKTASAWAATTAYSLGDKVLRSTGVGTEQTAGLYFVCTTAGTTGGSEPTWDTTVGNTTADGSVTWTCYAILYEDSDPGGASYSASYTDNEEFADGDTYRIRFAEMDGATSFKTYETTGLVSSTGFSVAVSVTADSVYATNAIDGSATAVTSIFTADYTNDEIDLDTNTDFKGTEAYAYYCYELTTSQGMYQFWGGVTALDVANYRINTGTVSLYFDETAGFVKQTDSVRWFRDDDARPALDPTTGGNGLEINWKNPVYSYDGGGGGFTTADRATLAARASQASVDTISTNVDQIEAAVITNAANADIAADIAAVKAETAAIVADTNELQTDWVDGGRLDLILDARATQASVDTVDTVADAIKAKTDQLTFTVANQVDSNVQYVNDTQVDGTGASGDEWGPA